MHSGRSDFGSPVLPVDGGARIRGLRAGGPYVFSAIGGFLFGYDNGGIAGSLLFIRRGLGLDAFMTGVVVSSIIFGAFLAAGAAGKLTDVFGPRRLLMAAGAILAFGSLAASLSVTPLMMVVSRIIIGIGVGTATVQVPMYLAEMAPTAHRGALTALFQIMLSSGILVALLVSYVLSDAGAWRLMLGVAIIPSVLLSVGMSRQPESPRWLCRHGRTAEARVVLLMRRGPAEAERELADMLLASTPKDVPLRKLLFERKVIQALLLAVGLTVLNDFSGITAVNYYAPTIFRAAGFGVSVAILISVGLAGLTLVCTIVTSLIVDQVGRRSLLIGGSATMAVTMSVLSFIFFSSDRLQGSALTVTIACFAIFKAAYALSWGPLIFVLLPEVLPLDVRGRGMGIATTVNWLISFVILLVFPLMLQFGPGSVYALFTVANVIGLLFIIKLLRETARISLEQIELTGSAEFRMPNP